MLRKTINLQNKSSQIQEMRVLLAKKTNGFQLNKKKKIYINNTLKDYQIMVLHGKNNKMIHLSINT